MVKEEIKEWVEERTDEEVVLFDNPDYAEAFVGLSDGGLAVYDYDRMVKCLMEDGMSLEEATEFIDYNVIGFGFDRKPIIVFRIENDS